MASTRRPSSQFTVTGTINIHPTNPSTSNKIRTSTMQRGRARWNPRDLLDLYPERSGFTCSGTTKKGLRCRQSFISRADLEEASAILDRLERKSARSITLDDLEDLAFFTLCPRWHKKEAYSQVEVLARKWMRKIERYWAERAAIREPTPIRIRTTTQSTRVDGRRPLLLAEASSSSDSSSEESSDSEGEAERDSETESTSEASEDTDDESVEGFSSGSGGTSSQQTQHSRTVSPESQVRNLVPARPNPSRTNASSRTIDPQPARAAETTPVTTPSTPSSSSFSNPVTPVSTSPTARPSPSSIQNTPAPTPLTPSSSVSASPRPTPIPTPPTPSTPESASPTLTPSTATSSSGSLIHPPPPPALSSTPRRKALTEPCCICHEPFIINHTSPPDDDVLYCRSQCGTNVHRSCFDEWRRTCFKNFETRLGLTSSDGTAAQNLTAVQKLERLECVTCVFCRGTWRWDWED